VTTLRMLERVRFLALQPFTAIVFFGASSVALRVGTGMPCPFKATTGWECPACGATRAGLALLRGEFLSAVRDNALVVAVGIIVFVAAITGGRSHSIRFSRVSAAAIVAVIILWTLIRNLPTFGWLRPVA
jgi:Protein of unknown function (DUF2752)